jgi:hypothetical protein
MKVLDAERSLKISIRTIHIKRAIQATKDNCVIAQSLKDRPDVVDVLIGSAVCQVEFTNGSILRYRTPKALRIGLNHWDKSGDWKLPEGEYFLEVIPPSQRKEAVKERAKVSVVSQVFKRTRKKHRINPRHIEFLRKKRVA